MKNVSPHMQHRYTMFKVVSTILSPRMGDQSFNYTIYNCVLCFTLHAVQTIVITIPQKNHPIGFVGT